MEEQRYFYRPALDLFKRALEISVSIGDADHEKLALNGLGACYLQSKQFEMALPLLTRLFEVSLASKYVRLRFVASQKVGDCYLELEDDEAALMWYERCMSAAREIDDPFEISAPLVI